MEIQRKKFVGGNWKSNLTFAQVQKFVGDVLTKIEFDSSKQDVIVAPVFLHIPFVFQSLQNGIKVSAQNVSATGMGAFTGEINAEQVKEFGLEWVIIGHSERRSLYGESDAVVAGKVRTALDKGLKVIACIGEKLEEREANRTIEVVTQQLDAIKGKVTEGDWSNIVIAYEPVWAIGTGKVATPEQAQEVHLAIRNYLNQNVSAGVGASTRIIYGGSVNGKNSADLIKQADIDGFLVGGASIKEEFKDIIASCNQ